MIIGTLLRHYKVHKWIRYIPVSNWHKFSAFIWENWIGKSSILEALDTFFNNTPWNINKSAISDGITSENFPYISIAFKIEKQKIKLKDDSDNMKILKILSTYFLWKKNTKKSTDKSEFEKFYTHKDDIFKNKNIDDYYFFLIGKKDDKYWNNEVYFSTYDNEIKLLLCKELNLFDTEDDIIDEKLVFKKHIKEDKRKILNNKLKIFLDFIINMYVFLYMPSETDVWTFTKIENQNMQKLMDKSIYEEISAAIWWNTAVSKINTKLKTYLGWIHKTLQTYEYKKPIGWKTNITVNDLSEKIIDAFFSIRILSQKKWEKWQIIPANSLSSWEKRQALIDVAYSFLETGVRDKDIIIAIDEPENSLHISACFDQFQKVSNIANLLNNQVIITTHWYGFLPIINYGDVHFLSTNQTKWFNINTIDLYYFSSNITKEKKNNRYDLPEDIHLKSTNELIQSIISSIRKEKPYNWIICEWISEKIYLSHFFKDYIKDNKLRILPVGWAPEVIRIFQYLSLPITEKKSWIKWKVFCFIDTDEQRIEHNGVKFDQINDYPSLKIRRLYNDNNLETVSLALKNPKYGKKTEIEDSLDSWFFLKTLHQFKDEPEIVKIISNDENIKKEAKNSQECLTLRPDDKDIIKEFFNKNNGNNKILFAEKYINICEENWNLWKNKKRINEIKKYLFE